MTLDEIVRDYICKYRDDARAQMRLFENSRSAMAAVRKAVPGGQRHRHQRRVSKAAKHVPRTVATFHVTY
jgi:hypothetical protein